LRKIYIIENTHRLPPFYSITYNKIQTSMKKLSLLFTFCLIAMIGIVSQLQAQSAPEDYFVGTWKVKAFGLPQGDTELIIQFTKKDGKLTGGILDGATNQINTSFYKVDVAGNKLTAHFIEKEQGMDVYLTLQKKDATNVTGSIMDMFNMEGSKSK
jgi:hypothetical protein